MGRDSGIERYEYLVIEYDQVFESGRRDDPVKAQATICGGTGENRAGGVYLLSSQGLHRHSSLYDGHVGSIILCGSTWGRLRRRHHPNDPFLEIKGGLLRTQIAPELRDSLGPTIPQIVPAVPTLG